MIKMGKNAPYLSVNAFSKKVPIGDTIFMSPTRDGTAILHGHPRSSKREVQGKGSTFISQTFYDPECWSGPGIQTRDLPLCSQALVFVWYKASTQHRPNKPLWERTLRRRGCGLIVNAED